MSPSKRTLGTLIVCVLVSLALPGAVGAIPSEASPVTEIDSCTTITESGQYELTEDIKNSDEERCIVIKANRVQFDGNGHLIDGVGDDNTVGVYISDKKDEYIGNFIIQNIEVTNWDEGILATSPDKGGETALLSNIEAHQNKDGIKGRDFDDLGMYDVEVYDNSDDGVHFKKMTEGRVGSGSHIYDNADDGVYFDRVGDGNVMYSTIENNGDDGIDHQSSANINIGGNLIQGNADDGVFFRYNSRAESSVRKNIIKDNGDDGVDIKQSTEVYVANNTICSNDHHQIVTRDGTDATFSNNNMTC